jgi:hypothetical protein
MNDLFLASLVAALLIAAAGALAVQWISHRAQMRTESRRAQGYRLIHALRAYSAWIECQRDLPFTARSLDDLTSPEPLTQVRQIKREHFPQLASHMLGLLQAHSRMIEYLWEQSLLRLTQGASWLPAHQDVRYQQLRGAQEDLIDDMIGACRALIGDSTSWKGTGSDFVFTGNSLGLPSQDPTSGA